MNESTPNLEEKNRKHFFVLNEKSPDKTLQTKKCVKIFFYFKSTNDSIHLNHVFFNKYYQKKVKW